MLTYGVPDFLKVTASCEMKTSASAYPTKMISRPPQVSLQRRLDLLLEVSRYCAQVLGFLEALLPAKAQQTTLLFGCGEVANCITLYFDLTLNTRCKCQ